MHINVTANFEIVHILSPTISLVYTGILQYKCWVQD